MDDETRKKLLAAMRLNLAKSSPVARYIMKNPKLQESIKQGLVEGAREYVRPLKNYALELGAAGTGLAAAAARPLITSPLLNYQQQQRVYNVVNNLGEQSLAARQMTGTEGQGLKTVGKVAADTINTGLTVSGTARLASPSGLSAMAIGGGLGVGFSAISGQDPIVGGLKSVGRTPRIIGLTTNVTDPVTQNVAGYAKNFLPSTLTRQLAGRFITGTGNVLEDELLSKLEGVDQTNQQRIMAFVIGFALSSGKSPQDYKTFRKNLNDEFGKYLKPSQVKQIDEIVQTTRPKHQIDLEEAYAQKDPVRMRTIIDSMDDNDPYKAPMKKMFDPIIDRLEKNGGYIGVGTRPGQIVARAVDSTDGKATLGKGTYFAFDAKNASRYGSDIKTFELDPEARMLDLSDPTTLSNFQQEAIAIYRDEFKKISKNKGVDEAIAVVTRKLAEGRNYDGIIGDDAAFGSVVFDKNKLTEISTDISKPFEDMLYNQVKNKVKTVDQLRAGGVDEGVLSRIDKRLTEAKALVDADKDSPNIGFRTKAVDTGDNPLLQEARKYKSAEEFVKNSVQTTDGINHLSPKQYGDFTTFVRDIEKLNDGTRPVDEIELAQKLWGDRPKVGGVEQFPVKDIQLAEKPLAIKPQPGRKITEPVIVEIIDGKPTLVDGRHRLDQAIANGETTIPAKVSGKSQVSQLTDIWKQANRLTEAKALVDADNDSPNIGFRTKAVDTGDKLYRGVSESDMAKSEISVTTDKNIAESFGNRGVVEGRLSAGTKVLKAEDTYPGKFMAKHEIDSPDYSILKSQVENYASKNGYDAVDFTSVSPEKEIKILNKAVFKAVDTQGGGMQKINTEEQVARIQKEGVKIAEGGDTKGRKLVARMKESDRFVPEVREKLEGDYVPITNKETITSAKRAVSKDAAAAELRALNPKTAEDVAIGMELFGYYMDRGNVAKANQIINATAGTNEGQMIQILRQYDKTSPEGSVRFAKHIVDNYNKRNPRNPLDLTDAEIKGIYTRAKGIAKMPEGRDKNKAMAEFLNDINKKVPSTLVDKLVTVWKAGLLTSLRTHERNLVGNSLMETGEIAKDVPASFVDRVLSYSTGKRSLTLTTQGLAEGGNKGLKSARDIVTLGYDPEDTIDKFDVEKINWGNNPVEQTLKKYTDAVFRTLGAADKPFWHSGFARSLYDQAGAKAINAGKSGDKAFIENLVQNPTEEMLKNAVKDANYATFHDKTMLGEAVSSLKSKLNQKEWGKLVSEGLVPFVGVPTSIVSKMVDYSPFGLFKGVFESGQVMSGVKDLQRQAAQDLGRGVVGTAIFALGAYLTQKGLMTGNAKDSNEYRQWELEGKQPNSIFIGGKWRSINSIGPQTIILLAGSKMMEEIQNVGPFSLSSFGSEIGKDTIQQSTLRGISDPINAITDPNRYGQSYLQGLATSVVPNIIGDTAKAADTVKRETNTIPEAIKYRLPILRNTLTPRRDALGQTIPETPSGLGAFVDLFNSRTPRSSVIIDELGRLNEAGFNATPSKLQKSQNILGDKRTLSPAELDLLERRIGEFADIQLTRLILSPEYQRLTDEQKMEAVDKTMTAVRKMARVSFGMEGQGQVSTPTEDTTVGNRLSTYEYLSGAGEVYAMPERSGYEKVLKRQKSYETANSVLSDELIPTEAKMEIIKKLKITPQNLGYLQVAKEDEEVRLAYVLDNVERIASTTRDRGEFLKWLALQRKIVNNKMIASNGLLDELEDLGLLTKSEVKALKSGTFDENGTAQVKTTGRGSTAKIKSAKFVPLNITKPTKLKALSEESFSAIKL